jgi:hypothetical protein
MLAPVCAARWTVGILEKSRVVVERASNMDSRAPQSQQPER